MPLPETFRKALGALAAAAGGEGALRALLEKHCRRASTADAAQQLLNGTLEASMAAKRAAAIEAANTANAALLAGWHGDDFDDGGDDFDDDGDDDGDDGQMG